jgi:hypothetical protein
LHDIDSQKDLMTSSEDLTLGFYDDEPPTGFFFVFLPFSLYLASTLELPESDR